MSHCCICHDSQLLHGLDPVPGPDQTAFEAHISSATVSMIMMMININCQHDPYPTLMLTKHLLNAFSSDHCDKCVVLAHTFTKPKLSSAYIAQHVMYS